VAANADFEIIVINDGSLDNTRAILDEFFVHQPNITIYHKPINECFGSAIRCGVKLAKKKFIFCVPADSPLTVDLYKAFSSHAHRADVLVSYRRVKLGYSLRRHINSYVYHKLVSVLFNMNLRDYNWIHMYDRKIFDEGEIEIEYDGIFMLAEILIKAQRAGFAFYEFEVEQMERLTGIATASKLSAIIKTLAEIIKFRTRTGSKK
jgi:glycosyltransferase involved in cell wall biosynthesis